MKIYNQVKLAKKNLLKMHSDVWHSDARNAWQFIGQYIWIGREYSAQGIYIGSP